MTDPNASIRALSARKRVAFSLVAMLLPFLMLGVAEVVLRAAGVGRERALFVPAPFDSAKYLIPNPRFAAKYFPGDPSPPTPPVDAMLREKPANGYRIFVLGESTTAGFPFAANGTFSRVLNDALRDALPGTPVEVINIGIPATNTYALVDELPEVLAQKPDAVLIYAGHNEYYGALGAASTVRLAGNPSLVRLVLSMRRLRLVQILERSLRSFRPQHPTAESGVSRMEELATNDTLRLGGAGYQRGVEQFRSNLEIILGRLRDAEVPAYVASLASNLRDQAPFASDSGGATTNAGAAFIAARIALDAHDPAAESLFARARDLDLIRFRAPREFNGIIRDVARAKGAIYVPVAEAFRAADPDHVPGDSLFFEHVHPRPVGTTIIARSFFEAMRASGFGGLSAQPLAAPWSEYTSRMALTPLDTDIATTIVDALKHRWPFAPRGTSSNFVESYTPRTSTDSLAFAVVTGRQTWVQAKLAEAAHHEQHHDTEAAVAAYRGLMRDQPWNESPFRFAARAELTADHLSQARELLERAYALRPTPFTCLTLARLVAADSTQLPRAASLLQQAMQLGGFNPDAAYQLSLVYARQGNVPAARAAAISLYRLVPNYPGLVEWMRLIGAR
jgi:lysophospholipase L1-like esterase